MATAVQKNFGLFTYVDGDGVSWNKRGEVESVRQAVDGSAAAGAHQVWFDSPRMRVRRITYQDPATFRTKSVIFYTAAAYAAITLNTSTLDFAIEGQATAITYTAVAKQAEKKPGARFPRPLIDHA